MSNATGTVRPSCRSAGAAATAAFAGSAQPEPPPERIFVVDDDYFAREYVCGMVQAAGWDVEAFSSCEAFIGANRPLPNSCVVLDIHFPGMGGLELLGRLGEMAHSPPIIVVSGSSGISEAVQSMKQGALDFIEKPLDCEAVLASVRRAFARSGRLDTLSAAQDGARDHLTRLTARQHEILGRVLDGQPSKNIAADLHISQRTVENHRASIMDRTGARSIPALAQMVMCSRCTVDS